MPRLDKQQWLALESTAAAAIAIITGGNHWANVSDYDITDNCNYQSGPHIILLQDDLFRTKINCVLDLAKIEAYEAQGYPQKLIALLKAKKSEAEQATQTAENNV